MSFFKCDKTFALLQLDGARSMASQAGTGDPANPKRGSLNLLDPRTSSFTSASGSNWHDRPYAQEHLTELFQAARTV